MSSRFIWILLVIILTCSIGVAAKEYSPVISGDYELGERTYIDIFDLENESDLDEETEEIIDTYTYNKLWLRFKQKLNKEDYYYLKIQYNNKEYQEKKNYNNIALDLWTNYTFRINDYLDNKVMVDYRDKDYQYNNDNTYQQIRLKYQLDYKLNARNEYSLYLQRKWKDYPNNEDKDNTYDRVSVSWDWDLSDKLTINSKIQFDWTEYKPISESSNKDSKKFNVGFKLEL